MTNYGELGQIYEKRNADQLADCLLHLSKNSSVSDFEKHIPKALSYANANYDWKKIIKKLAFMLSN